MLNCFPPVSVTPRKLTYLYQKFNFIAISRWLERQKAEGSRQKAEGRKQKAVKKE
jgi:hypothetical protein